MAYETQNEPRQVVLNEPPIQREFVTTESVYVPESRGFSGIAVAALVIGAVALVTVIFLVMMNNRANANDNAQAMSRNDQASRNQQQQPIVVQQPAAQQPIVVQQPAAAPAPIVVQQPADTSKASPEVDQWIQAEFERKMMDDEALAGLAVTVESVAGKVTLKGTVANDKLKSDVEKMTRSINGVKNVDNQIIVNAS
jgi:hypothetical protein